MTPLTFYVDETYGPHLVDLLQEKDLHAVTYRNVCNIPYRRRPVTASRGSLGYPRAAARWWPVYWYYLATAPCSAVAAAL